LVVVGTGITASTTKVVGDVRALKEKDPQWFADVMKRYDALATDAIDAIRSNNVAKLGALMDANHVLCRELTISCPELEAIVSSAKQNGALGAKLSGTGRGGIAVALAKDKAHQERMGMALRETCPAAKFVWLYSVVPPATAGKSKL
jgi:mevalonate kinase